MYENSESEKHDILVCQMQNFKKNYRETTKTVDDKKNEFAKEGHVNIKICTRHTKLPDFENSIESNRKIQIDDKDIRQ